MRKAFTRVGLLWIIGAVLLLGACGTPEGVDEEPLMPTAPTSDAEPGGKAFVESLNLVILESFPVQVRAQITGNLSDGCTEIAAINVVRDEDAQTYEIVIETTRDPEAMCTQALVPFEESVPLDVLNMPAGTYTVTAGDQTATFELAVDNVLEE
jgi:inhibitor of cysteine peptidase